MQQLQWGGEERPHVCSSDRSESQFCLTYGKGAESETKFRGPREAPERWRLKFSLGRVLKWALGVQYESRELLQVPAIPKGQCWELGLQTGHESVRLFSIKRRPHGAFYPLLQASFSWIPQVCLSSSPFSPPSPCRRFVHIRSPGLPNLAPASPDPLKSPLFSLLSVSPSPVNFEERRS